MPEKGASRKARRGLASTQGKDNAARGGNRGAVVTAEQATTDDGCRRRLALFPDRQFDQLIVRRVKNGPPRGGLDKQFGWYGLAIRHRRGPGHDCPQKHRGKRFPFRLAVTPQLQDARSTIGKRQPLGKATVGHDRLRCIELELHLGSIDDRGRSLRRRNRLFGCRLGYLLGLLSYRVGALL